MKRVIFIGSVGSGKTTISQVLSNQELAYKKTQMVEIVDSKIIDTPGEYLDRVQMRGALMITSADVDVICLIQSAVDEKTMIPPGYAGSFAKPVIGIVTKKDIAEKEQIDLAINKLKNAGAERCFVVSSYSKEGMEELIAYLEETQN